MSNVGAVILAAGKGKRMKSKAFNKVTLELGGKPMIKYAVELAQSLKLSPIIVVVGFAKESVKKLIGEGVIYTEQKKRLGTAHAVSQGLKTLPRDATDVLVIQGDDSAFYKKEILQQLINSHIENNNAITFLTVEVSNPFGLGRIVRDKNGKVLAIVEEKDATRLEREIKEINPACYVFNLKFLKKYLPKVPKSSVSGEYYLVSLVDIAIKNKQKLQDIEGGFIPWRGVNTNEELEEAQALFQKVKPSIILNSK